MHATLRWMRQSLVRLQKQKSHNTNINCPRQRAHWFDWITFIVQTSFLTLSYTTANHCTILLPSASRVNNTYNVNSASCTAVFLLWHPVIRRRSAFGCSPSGTSIPAFITSSRSDLVQPSCQNIGCELSAPAPSAMFPSQAWATFSRYSSQDRLIWP